MNLTISEANRIIHKGLRPDRRFNFMVAGATGIGKSSFIVSFLRQVSEGKMTNLPSTTIRTTEINEVGRFVNNGHMVCCYDSFGIGDLINNDQSIKTIKDYLINQHKDWLDLDKNLMKEKEINEADGRIHCIFYFFSPHRINDIDKEFFKELCNWAPIVPVLAKADTMTQEERDLHLGHVCMLIENLKNSESLKNSGDTNHNNVIFPFQEEGNDFTDPEILIKQFKEATIPRNEETLPGNERNNTVAVGSEEEDQEEHILEEMTLEGNISSQYADYDTLEMSVTEVAHTRPVPMVEALPIKLQQCTKVRDIFAVITSARSDGKRIFPWIKLDIYEKKYSDLSRLQKCLFVDGNIERMVRLASNRTIVIVIVKTIS